MHQRIIPFAFPGNTMPKATFAGVHRTPLRANAPLFDVVPKAPSAPSGHLPRKGEVYLGRFVNRPYRNYSLFIRSNVSSRLSPGHTVSHIHRSKKPPLPKGGVGGDSVPLPRQHRADGDVCGRSQNAPTGQCAVVRYRAKGSLSSPEMGRFIYGAIRESPLPLLFTLLCALFTVHLIPT